MDNDPDLFGHEPHKAYARNSDPGTSHAAAAAVEEHLPRLEIAAARACHSQGEYGMTNSDLVQITGLAWESITPRMKQLLLKGVVELRYDPQTNRPLTRRGSKGKQQQIHWFVRWPDAR